ncbi:MAG: hypothetical protein QM793_00400 [Muricomes sp.]
MKKIRGMFRRVLKLSAKKACFALLIAGSVFALSGCGNSAVEYQITVEGTLEEAGVVSCLGYDINVYADQASNPCGGCTKQPVHLFVGDSAQDVVEAIQESIGES